MLLIIIGGLLVGYSMMILFDAESDVRCMLESGNIEHVQESREIVRRYFLLGLVGAIIMVAPLLFG